MMKSKITAKQFFLKQIDKFVDDETTTLAASLAFYMALSVSPILILFVVIAAKLNFSVTQVFLAKTYETLGPQAAKIIDNVIQNSQEKTDFASVASWISIFFLLLSASLVFGQTQMALNKIFQDEMPCEQQPNGRTTIICIFIKQKIFYTLSVLGFIVLLIATIASSSLIFNYLPSQNVVVAFMLSIISSLFIYTSVFTFMYRYIPQTKRAWRFSFYGGLLTALFFILGTQIISLYLSYSDVGMAFGASGSLLIFLVWVYYSSMTILVGAQVSSLLISLHERERKS